MTPHDALIETVDESVIAQMINRAASPGFESWWGRLAGAGFCTNPVHLAGRRPDGTPLSVMTRCKNRRASVCPSCSELYAGDTWQLVHAGLAGGHGVSESVADHPTVFATLTAPSFGLVHAALPGTRGRSRRCNAGRRADTCLHGRSTRCNRIHDDSDPLVGQPLCPDCYDYPAHVLFTWHAPELWRRFTIALRRQLAIRLRADGLSAKSVRAAFVKVVEMQRRAVPHFHAVIRLDPTQDDDSVSIGAADLVPLVVRAATAVKLHVAGIGGESVSLSFGAQLDVQAIQRQADTSVTDQTNRAPHSRKVAGYLAKYVTKSVNEFGLAPRRLSPTAINSLNVTPHVRQILRTITQLAAEPDREPMLRWLHTLGYRGHTTTKSRAYSVTMAALRANRELWRSAHGRGSTAGDAQPAIDRPAWSFNQAGHANAGDRLLSLSATAKAREARWAARDAQPAATPGGQP